MDKRQQLNGLTELIGILDMIGGMNARVLSSLNQVGTAHALKSEDLLYKWENVLDTRRRAKCRLTAYYKKKLKKLYEESDSIST